MQPLIALDNLQKTYHLGDTDVRALAGVTLAIGQGELTAIMGPSGSGKSTLMNLLGCLDTPTGGRYQLDGVEVSSLNRNELAEIRNRKVGFVFQNFNLLPRTSALENVELPLLYAGIPSRERRQRALAALQQVGLGERMGHTPGQMSGGQQQRVAIARALVNRPQLILADEPTGNLDSRTSHEIMALFQNLWKAGMTILLVTHESDIAAFSARVLSMKDGLLVGDQPQTPKSATGADA